MVEISKYEVNSENVGKGCALIESFFKQIKHPYNKVRLKESFQKYQDSKTCNADYVAQRLLDFLHAHFATEIADVDLAAINNLKKKSEQIISLINKIYKQDSLGLQELICQFQQRLEILEFYQTSKKDWFIKKSTRKESVRVKTSRGVERGKLLFHKIKYHLFELIDYFYEIKYSETKEAAIIEVQQLLSFLCIKKNHAETTDGNLRKDYYAYSSVTKQFMDSVQ